MRRLVLAIAILSPACGSSDPDVNGGDVGGKGSGSTLGGSDTLACKVVSTAPVGWNDSTALGVPSALFAPFAGTCQAPFKWDGSSWSDVTIAPEKGQSTLTATVVVDQASTRSVTRTPGCGDALEVDGKVTLSLPEGQVASEQPITLVASGGEAPLTFSFALKEEAFGPWISIQKVNPAATLGMSFQVGAPGRSCSGSIMLSYQLVTGNRGMGAGGPLAVWSDSGCAAGQDKLDLVQPGPGADVASAIVTNFGQMALPGAWADGTSTTLTVTTSLSAKTACLEQRNGLRTVIVPVAVVASTADGRVTGLAGEGNVRATSSLEGLLELQLWLSTDLTCTSTLDRLAYTPADCSKVSKVTAQLGANRYPINPTTDSTSLNLYVYDRQGVGTGAADRVDTWRVGP